MKVDILQRMKPGNFSTELFSGLTTAVISLPLAIAFGVASGLGPEAGIYGAVILGAIAAIFGGSSTLISEPTGPMTVMMAAVLARDIAAYPEYGALIAFTSVMIAGLVQILFGTLKLGRYFTMMPYSVISGFMSGIGVLLIITQIPILFGAPKAASSIFTMVPLVHDALQQVSWSEIILSMAALIVLFATPKAIRKFLPPQLIALVVGILIGVLFLPEGSFRTIGEMHLKLPTLHFPRIPAARLVNTLVDGVLLGVLGCIDTLLTAMIADSLTREQHDSNRELIGQGIANLTSGFFGGLPGAGATMGTVVNIETGARRPFAGIVRSLVLVAFVSVLAPFIKLVPMAVLAAIAVKVGFNILDWSFLGRSAKISMTATMIMYAVLILTVFIDLLVAVGVGVFVANVITIERLTNHSGTRVSTIDSSGGPVSVSPEEKEIIDHCNGSLVLFHLGGPMIFGVGQAIARETAALKDGARYLVLDLKEVSFMSTTVNLSIENLVLEALSDDRQVFISGASPEVREKLSRTEIPATKAEFHDSRLEALQAVKKLLDADGVA